MNIPKHIWFFWPKKTPLCFWPFSFWSDVCFLLLNWPFHHLYQNKHFKSKFWCNGNLETESQVNSYQPPIFQGKSAALFFKRKKISYLKGKPESAQEPARFCPMMKWLHSFLFCADGVFRDSSMCFLYYLIPFST